MAGKPSLTPAFTVYPPSPQELKEIFKNDPNIKIDFTDPFISNQIKNWKPLKWSIPISCPPPLNPADYLSGKHGKLFISLCFLCKHLR